MAPTWSNRHDAKARALTDSINHVIDEVQARDEQMRRLIEMVNDLANVMMKIDMRVARIEDSLDEQTT